MYGSSTPARARRVLTTILATVALIFGSFAVAAPASAAPDKGSGVTTPWQFSKAAATPTGPSTDALCQTPTRWTNAVSWNCTVFGGQVIQAWMQCDNQVYYSDFIPEGSWYILGICPAGTWRVTEGILYY
jgi:hypothetical protein